MNNSNAFHSWIIGVIRIFAILAGLLWLGALLIRADTHYVSLTGGNVSPYTNWTDAASNDIQAAINAASAGETVLVTNGTYNLTSQISITNNLTVRSVNGTNVTIVDGNYPAYTNRCFYINNGTLNGFTVSNGFYTNNTWLDGGGGICIQNTGYVYNCFIYGNSYSNAQSYSGGGGVYLMSGGIVSNCTIISNTVYYSGGGESDYKNAGGGVFLYSNGLVVASRISGNTAYLGGGTYQHMQPSGVRINRSIVSNCVVDNNRGTYSYGGMYVVNSDCRVANCVISNNVAPNKAGIGAINSVVMNSIIIGNVASNNYGGVWLDSGSLMSNCQVIANVAVTNNGRFGGVYLGQNGANMVVNCIIAANLSSGYGAGIYMVAYGSYSHIIRNCLIYDNTNQVDTGGGVYSYNSPPAINSIINCTIANNKAQSWGGGIYLLSTNAYIENCIIYSNVTIGDVPDEVYPTTAVYLTDYWHTCSSIALANGQGNITNNPLFVDQTNRNYRLSKSSPCINTGSNQDWMTDAVDLDGRKRIRYGTVDMGVYECIHEATFYNFH